MELSKSKAEGMIPFASFKENYALSDNRFIAYSRNKKKSLKMGDKIRVRVTETNLEARQIELALV